MACQDAGTYDPNVRWALATITAAALLAVPAASAKTLTKVVALGAGGMAVELHGLGWDALQTTSGAAPAGGYVLVYPLMERGIPARPGRFYPVTGTACFSWDRSALGTCGSISDDVARAVADLPLLDGAPTILDGLTVAGRAGRINSNGAVAIELAFARTRAAKAMAKRPSNCLAFAARWTGSEAALRPKRFWSCSAGLWAAGKLYPVGPLAGI